MASIYGAVSATGWRLRLDYTVSQDAAANRSTLALALYIYDGTGESYNQAANSCRYILQGKTVYQPYRYESKGWYKLGGGSVTVDHRADGSGSAALSAAWYSGFSSQWTPGSLSVSQTVTLPVIPRASMLQAGAMTLGQSGTITVQRADAGFTHKIDYQIGSTHGAVCGKTGETRVTWMPPLSLAEEITDAVAGDCVLTATTYSGSSVVGTSSCTIKLYVPEEVKPTASLAAQVVNDNAVIAGWGVCVREYSCLGFQVTAAVAVHLAQGGTAVGVGKYAEHDKAVDIAPDWDVWFRGKRLLDAVWPVGSLYLSAADSDPGVLFGGTWQRVKDRFLLAAGDVYEPGETGGEAQHTLTKAEMPAHTHGYDFTGQSDVTGVTAIRLYDADGRRNEYQGASASAGGGAAHNNMPPYLAVYVWRRTA